MTGRPAGLTGQGPACADPGPHIVVIGGGASGVLMATHLLSRPERAFRVTVIEGRNAPGRGLAYSTKDPDHLLNTRANNMSAFPEAPHHFMDWLQAQPEGAGITGQCFVSRATYGRYLSDLMSRWTAADTDRRLRFVRQTVLRLVESPRGVVAHLSDGQTVIGDMAILATGHVLQAPDPDGLVTGAWDSPHDTDPVGRVVIVGSGLSMIDQVLSLLKAGHRGPILSVSRRGQLPRPHAPTTPLPLTLGDIPLGAPVSVLLEWARHQARVAVRRGGTWRDAVDGIRPHVRSIWRSLPPVERARFLRHAATWWDVHRHRMPPKSECEILQAIALGQLVLQRGSYLGPLRASGGGLMVRLRPRGQTGEVQLPAARIIDCRGIRRDPETQASPLVADLLASGRARIDPLRIGLDVDPSCRLIDRQGRPSARILAIGPASRAAFWEITAIPDIRTQTWDLAARLAAPVPARTAPAAIGRD